MYCYLTMVIFKFKRKMLRLIIACIFYQSVVVDSKGDVAKSLVSKAKPSKCLIHMFE